MSNRNFDSIAIIQRLRDQNIAQQLRRVQESGQTFLRNPQNSDASPSIIQNYTAGTQTTYSKSLNGGYTSSIGVSGK